MYLGRVVEYGSVDQVLRTPRHPYTQALLQSVPSLDADKNVELKTVDGQTPSPAEVTKGCEFAERCLFATDTCRDQIIPLMTFEGNHQVRCIRLDEKGNLPKPDKAGSNV
jgi:oligopeptide/dipeptide ABC transporter ATP-binding protein